MSCQLQQTHNKKEHAIHSLSIMLWKGTSRALTELEGGGRFVSPHGTPSWWAKGILPSPLFLLSLCLLFCIYVYYLFTVLSTHGTQHRRKVLVNLIDFPSLITLFYTYYITTVPTHDTVTLRIIVIMVTLLL